MDEKQLTFDTVLPEKLPEPKLDKDKMSATVLVNLLGNAVKYTPAGRAGGVSRERHATRTSRSASRTRV